MRGVRTGISGTKRPPQRARRARSPGPRTCPGVPVALLPGAPRAPYKAQRVTGRAGRGRPPHTLVGSRAACGSSAPRRASQQREVLRLHVSPETGRAPARARALRGPPGGPGIPRRRSRPQQRPRAPLRVPEPGARRVPTAEALPSPAAPPGGGSARPHTWLSGRPGSASCSRRGELLGPGLPPRCPQPPAPKPGCYRLARGPVGRAEARRAGCGETRRPDTDSGGRKRGSRGPKPR